MNVTNIAYSGTALQPGPGRHSLALSRPIDWPLGSRVLVRSITRVDTQMVGSLVELQDADMRITIESDPDTRVHVDSSEAWNVVRLTTAPEQGEAITDTDALVSPPGWRREELESLRAVEPMVWRADEFEASLPDADVRPREPETAPEEVAEA
jgi:hypothetical protein